jgi:hypothetical protein
MMLLQWGRGIDAADEAMDRLQPTAPAHPCFNEAAASMPRMRCALYSRDVMVCTLQWGRGIDAADEIPSLIGLNMPPNLLLQWGRGIDAADELSGVSACIFSSSILLQWGRGIDAADENPSWNARRRNIVCFNEAAASMPRMRDSFFSSASIFLRFNEAAASMPRMRNIPPRPFFRNLVSFNEAAASMPRMSTMPPEPSSKDKMLQWGRGIDAADEPGRFTIEGNPAFTLQWGRGIDAADELGFARASGASHWLQWGRGIDAADEAQSRQPWCVLPFASMRPRHRCRGWGTGQGIANPEGARFNEAAASMPRMSLTADLSSGMVSLLQWGRGIDAADEGAQKLAQSINEFLLQWGRGIDAADEPIGCLRIFPGCGGCFNRANEDSDDVLRRANEAMAKDFSARATAGDRNRMLLLVDGVAPEFWHVDGDLSCRRWRANTLSRVLRREWIATSAMEPRLLICATAATPSRDALHHRPQAGIVPGRDIRRWPTDRSQRLATTRALESPGDSKPVHGKCWACRRDRIHAKKVPAQLTVEAIASQQAHHLWRLPRPWPWHAGVASGHPRRAKPVRCTSSFPTAAASVPSVGTITF